MWWDRHHQKYTYVSCGTKMMTWLDFCLIPRNTTVSRKLKFQKENKNNSSFWEGKTKGSGMTFFFCKISSRSSNNVSIRLSSFSIFVHPPWKLKVTGWEREMSCRLYVSSSNLNLHAFLAHYLCSTCVKNYIHRRKFKHSVLKLNLCNKNVSINFLPNAII